MPVIVVANKIDMDPTRAQKSFGFVEKKRQERGGKDALPFFFVSASDGSNVVTIFKQAIKMGCEFKTQLQRGSGGTFVDDVLQFIEDEEKRPDGVYQQ